MTPGSREWVERSLRDWALTVGQGMALVTYRSYAARDGVLGDLKRELEEKGLRIDTLTCANCTAQSFVDSIAKSDADVLFVLDPDRVLFGENDDSSRFWVNFHRETIVGRPGVQIWWFLPGAAIRFGRQLPDLGRFFLFREDLTEEAQAEQDRPLAIQTQEVWQGDAERGRDLLQRALRAAASPNADPVRVWLELGLPAINELRRSRQVDQAIEAFSELVAAAGTPEAALKQAADLGESEQVARGFLILGNLYSDLGRREDALAHAEEAARIYRQLAQQRPDAFLPDLAMSLSNLATMLSALGRREDAFANAEEAVRIYRQLAQQRPDAFLPDLASSLNNLANRLSDLGRREDAFANAEEAVRINRQLAQQRPEAFLPDLAMSLNNLANALSNLGRREDALAHAEEAVRIRRQLAQQRPDAFLPDLATSLNNLAPMLSALGRREDALAHAEEAVRIRRQLAQQRPDAFLPDLATSLNNLAPMLSALGRREDALAHAEEAVRIRRQLAQQRPDAFLPDLANSLNNLANMLSDLGRPEDALANAEEAVRIRRQLAQQRPDAFLHDLAGSLNNLANRLSALGRREDALAKADEAVRIYRQLVQQRPDVFVPDLARALAVRGKIIAADRPADAIPSIEEAIRLLTPAFLRLPEAHKPLMRSITSLYRQTAEAAGLTPDPTLLAPIAGVLEGKSPLPE